MYIINFTSVAIKIIIIMVYQHKFIFMTIKPNMHGVNTAITHFFIEVRLKMSRNFDFWGQYFLNNFQKPHVGVDNFLGGLAIPGPPSYARFVLKPNWNVQSDMIKTLKRYKPFKSHNRIVINGNFF